MARKTRSKNLRSVDSLMKIPGLSATIIHHNKVSVFIDEADCKVRDSKRICQLFANFYGSFSDLIFFKKIELLKKELGLYGKILICELSSFIDIRESSNNCRNPLRTS